MDLGRDEPRIAFSGFVDGVKAVPPTPPNGAYNINKTCRVAQNMFKVKNQQLSSLTYENINQHKRRIATFTLTLKGTTESSTLIILKWLSKKVVAEKNEIDLKNIILNASMIQDHSILFNLIFDFELLWLSLVKKQTYWNCLICRQSVAL